MRKSITGAWGQSLGQENYTIGDYLLNRYSTEVDEIWKFQPSPEDELVHLCCHAIFDKRLVKESYSKRIDELFKQAYSGKVRAQDLHKELNDWDLFDEYQDQFFSIFK